MHDIKTEDGLAVIYKKSFSCTAVIHKWAAFSINWIIYNDASTVPSATVSTFNLCNRNQHAVNQLRRVTEHKKMMQEKVMI